MTIPEIANLTNIRSGHADVEVGNELVGSVRLRSGNGSAWVPYRPYGAPLRERGSVVRLESRVAAVAYLVERHLEETADAD